MFENVGEMNQGMDRKMEVIDILVAIYDPNPQLHELKITNTEFKYASFKIWK